MLQVAINFHSHRDSGGGCCSMCHSSTGTGDR